jgi:flagellin
MTATGLGLRQGDGTDGMISLSTSDGANMTIGTIDAALKMLNKQRADLGAYQNRLEHATKGLAIGAENLQAAESVIRDTDMASEMVNFTRDNILVQASTSMLAQANQKTQAVMRLLQ